MDIEMAACPFCGHEDCSLDEFVPDCPECGSHEAHEIMHQIITIQSSTLWEAVQLSINNIKVFPVELSEPDEHGKRKKTPLTPNGHKSATTDIDTIMKWWRKFPDAVPGVPTGIDNGIDVIDEDPEGHEWAHAHSDVLMQAGKINHSERGTHYLFRHSDGVRNSAGKIHHGIDVRGEGGWIVWWPALGKHTEGELEDIQHPPQELLELMLGDNQPGYNAGSSKVQDGGKVIEGQRNQWLTSEAGSLRRRGHGGHELAEMLSIMNKKRCSPPLEESEVQTISNSVCRYDPAQQIGELEEWPDLIPLDAEPPQSIPVEEWPQPLSEYALALSRETETPPELAGLLVLGTLSTAVQKLADVQIKPGYKEPINVYTAVALPPATRKSGVFKKATSPLVQWEADQRKNAAQELKAAESRLKTHKERVSHLRKQAAKAKDETAAKELAEQIAELEAKEPEIPSLPRLFTSDVTTEHLATMMNEYGGVMAGMSAEGGIFETMAGRYNQGTPNIDLYLMAHAGDAVRVDRGSKSAVILDNPRLTMTLAVQPDVLNAMSTKPGFKGRGLLGRFLYALPPSNLGKRTGTGTPVDPFTEHNYKSRILELIGAAQQVDTPGTVDLSDEAREIWQEFWHGIESQLGKDGCFEHCTDWAGKLPGAVARIAALFHFARYGVEGAWESIGAEDMRVAISTGEALASHALAVFGLMGADPDIEGAKVITNWIRRKSLTEFSLRDVHQNHKSRFERADDIKPPLDVMLERGYIQPAQKQENQKGRPSERYRVNPKALE